MDVSVVCPYCDSQKVVTFNQIYPSGEDVHCNNSQCFKGWHEGIYRAFIFVIEKQDKRGLGKNRPTVYTLRLKTDSGGEQLIDFSSMQKGIMIKRGDLISLSYRKKSRGIFHKEWTGEWEDKPRIFKNLTVKTYWKI